ncbi:hypothetical protein UFOVP221_136 [uncultured Caudovirales phage]|uniref:Uncharacterized protein n=1 Tax=uncultured Caudovirales phage TaxID=2100421 RepID=A0A6J7WPE7_9CAUD|nr:hypothetical protein UFOVP221_136 [uncultured Caudovirales phage]
MDKFNDIGLVFNKPSVEQVTLPPDITMLSSEQLAEKFTGLTAWADYVASQMAMAIIEERGAKNAFDFEENKQLVSKMGAAARGERITLVKAQISIDPKIQELSQAYEEKYAYRKLVEMILNNHERDLSLVSREITRRGSDQRALRKDWGAA